MQDAHCLDEGWLTLGCGIANTIADLLIILLPVPLIAKLDLPPRRRFGAIILVSFGLVVCIAGSIRAYCETLSNSSLTCKLTVTFRYLALFDKQF